MATFETAGHVYTIFTEPALETYNLLHQKAVYSRIARVCKNDMGSSGSDHTFSTYFKARMLCGMPQASNGKGSYPYYFDEVGTYAHCPASAQYLSIFLRFTDIPKPCFAIRLNNIDITVHLYTVMDHSAIKLQSSLLIVTPTPLAQLRHP